MSCQAPSGSLPITYRLVSKDRHVHMQQTDAALRAACQRFLPTDPGVQLVPVPGWK